MSVLALIVASPMAMAPPHELLYADYEGTVTAVVAYQPDNPYHIGEHIQGRLTIDVTLAEQVPNDLLDVPKVRQWGLDEPGYSPDFVTGFLPIRPSDGGFGTDR